MKKKKRLKEVLKKDTSWAGPGGDEEALKPNPLKKK
jgi:hypothetical protein